MKSILPALLVLGVVIGAGVIAWMIFNPSDGGAVQRQLDATRDSVRSMVPKLNAATKQIQELHRDKLELQRTKETLWQRFDSLANAPVARVVRKVTIIDTNDVAALRVALTTVTLERDMAEANTLALQARIDGMKLIAVQIQNTDSTALVAQQKALTAIQTNMDSVRMTAVVVAELADRSQVRRIGNRMKDIGTKATIAVVFFLIGSQGK